MKSFYVWLFLSSFLWLDEAWARKKKEKNVFKKVYEELTVKIPQAEEICFSPDEPCDVKLIKFMQSAQKSLDVAVFDITLDQLVHELIVLSKKIPVRMVVDLRQAKGDYSLVSTLQKAGVQLRFGKQRGIMHHKFMIVDGKKIETGSFNYSNNASMNNQENQIYLDNPKIVERYKIRFEKMWKEAFLKSPESY